MSAGQEEREALAKARLERREIVAKYDQGRVEGVKIDDWEDPKLELYHIQDRYGFLHDERLPDSGGRSEKEIKHLKLERDRTTKWAEMLRDEKRFFGPKAKNREKMINRIYKGIPDSVRGRVWSIILEVEKTKIEHKGTYQKMRSLARIHSPDIRQIDLDVNRTYRDHIMFRERYNNRQVALFHVLAAYSMYNSEVGYCQGMSQIAALLLMYLTEEEDAFWALSRIMVHPKYSMHGFFIQGFPKLMRFQRHHDKILKKFLPKLKKHLDKNNIDTGIYTLKWFFQCFLDRIPFSLTLRVWDLYLLEGERIMIGMAYNILRMHRRYLMKLAMDELIEHLQINLEKDFGYEDDVAIEKLREVISELSSNRLDSPGRPPPEELPTRPFGLIPDLVPEVEIGLRTGLTEQERDISFCTLSAKNPVEDHGETKDRIPSEEFDESHIGLSYPRNEDRTGTVDFLDNSDVMNTSSATGGFSSAMETSLDSTNVAESIPVFEEPSIDSSSHKLRDYRHPKNDLFRPESNRPHSEAIDRLDESVRFMMHLNGDVNDRDNTEYKGCLETDEMVFRSKSSTSHLRNPACERDDPQKRYSHIEEIERDLELLGKSASDADVSNGKIVSKSYEQERLQHSVTRKEIKKTKNTFLSSTAMSHQEMVISKGDVVRIKVPYGRDGSDKLRP